MTLAIAWVRDVKGCEELIFATDSRLSGGLRIDCGPKIMVLPRSDSAVCFAGDTLYAYPFMMQMYSAIASYPKSLDRSLDIHDLRGHILNIFNQMRSSVTDYVDGEQHPKVSFILGGYSWIRKAFSLWLINYDSKSESFSFDSARRWGRRIWLTGTKEYVKEARDRLNDLLRERNGFKKPFDMEPFEILRDMLREHKGKRDAAIGGPPQVLKIYQHMNCRPLGVYWPNRKSGKVTIFGRTLLDYENTNYSIMDPDTLKRELRKASKKNNVADQIQLD
jgi:hypothetical protein